MTTVTISMPDSLKSFLESEVAEKGYGNTSEYIRELLRGAQKRAADERLEQALLDGLNSGPGREWTPEYRAELRDKAEQLKSRFRTTQKQSAPRTEQLKPPAHVEG